MIEEAQLEEAGSGLVPATEGWFVVNVRDAAWRDHATFGADCRFEGSDAPFSQLGINICVLQPGQPNCRYHRESLQEDFLVLAGECLLLVEEQEKRLQAWDFVHCPSGTDHVFIGAGDGACAILMTGARRDHEELVYPVSELALRHDAGVEVAAGSPGEAYAAFPEPLSGRPSGWEKLPWATRSP
jgi:uncharacterized cupin superfamily protein